MSDVNKYIELIEKYLDGELSTEEAQAFEVRLQEDAELHQEYELYQLSQQIIVSNKLHSVEDVVKEVQTDFKKSVKRKKYVKNGLIVFVGTLLLAGGYYVIDSADTTNTPQSVPEKIEQHLPEKDTITKDKSTPKQQQPEEKTSIDTAVGRDKSTADPTKEKSQEAPSEKPDATVTEEDDSDKASIEKDTVVEEVPEGVKVEGDSFKAQAIEPDSSAAPCDHVSLTATAETRQPCKGEADGEIRIKEAKGGTKPYTYTLMTDVENQSGVFRALEQGEYIIAITDAAGCETQLKPVDIEEKLCKVDLFFDPLEGDLVRFPEHDRSGILTIFDKQANVKFKKNIEADQQFQWDIQSDQGKLSPGYYLFMIEYEDGNVQKGSLTVLP